MLRPTACARELHLHAQRAQHVCVCAHTTHAKHCASRLLHGMQTHPPTHAPAHTHTHTQPHTHTHTHAHCACVAHTHARTHAHTHRSRTRRTAAGRATPWRTASSSSRAAGTTAAAAATPSSCASQTRARAARCAACALAGAWVVCTRSWVRACKPCASCSRLHPPLSPPPKHPHTPPHTHTPAPTHTHTHTHTHTRARRTLHAQAQELREGDPGVAEGGEVRRQHWCCGGVQHFDISYWGFEQLAHPVSWPHSRVCDSVGARTAEGLHRGSDGL
jgi:hypothetical protein